jgi:predicted adenine nucleotide alpha hydrolase (AANH) superfamily ATPase
MLVHICCSVDSHYFLQKIQEEYPDKKIVGFFYDPNIQPYSEYRLRLLDVQYSCDLLGIELIEGDYDITTWQKIVKGLEQEPEKGDRCTVCFDRRLSISAQKAKELKHTSFTTTLLISPKKSQDKLSIIGKKLARQYDITFIFKDYRVKNGVELQGLEVKKNKIYRQNYCGCMYGLLPQREYQDRLADELMCPIGQQILPNSIEYRLELYKKRDLSSNIIKQKFLNYRLLSAKVEANKQTIPSYFLFYSTTTKELTKGKIEKVVDNIGYFNKDEIKFITLKYFNQLLDTNYKNIYELIYNPPIVEDEIKLRYKLTANSYDLSVIVVLDNLPTSKLEIICKSKTYSDTKEIIL